MVLSFENPEFYCIPPPPELEKIHLGHIPNHKIIIDNQTSDVTTLTNQHHGHHNTTINPQKNTSFHMGNQAVEGVKTFPNFGNQNDTVLQTFYRQLDNQPA